MKHFACVCAMAGVILLSGCSSNPTTGYSTQSIYPTKYRTVAIPVIRNDTYFRDVGFLLTQALISEIESRTPYKVTSETYADSLLTGRITAVELTALSQNRTTGLDEEVIIGVTVNFEWMDLEDDTTIVKRRNFEGSGLFVPTPPSGEFLEVGEVAVVQQLASDMVDEMQAAW
ncbi:MAG TPA: hypothetical protein DEO57_01835 [Phycisphaerales bacterium]|nr:hypothetical protein [Phycisphaerales bacterium]|tara:strand:+ start:57 stop:575 length:519 start_codon:yes stop_codon:yes gene_type:complete